jgi:Cytochrome C oxidase, cbb3-type, subunit III
MKTSFQTRYAAFLMLFMSMFALTAYAQTNIPAGQTLYSNNCLSCHGGPPNFDARARRAANNVSVLNSAISNVNSMQFLSFLTQAERANIAAYIGNPNGSGPTQQAQTITFPVPNSFVWNSAGVSLSATASSGLPISYAVQFGNCTITGNQLTAFGTGSCTIAATQAGNTAFSAATQVTRSVTVGVGDFSDMWWAGSTQNGWGMSIQQRGTTQFNALYVYDAQGQPRWYVMPGGTWNSNSTSYTGAVYQPTSAPFSAYDKSKFVVGAPSGNVTLNYNANGTMTMQYNIAGTSGSKTMERQTFAGGTAPLQANALWWAGVAEDGWGINIAQQQGNLFAVWYTYGADGKAFWFVLPAGTWSGNTFEGTLFSTVGSSWFGVYNPASLVVNNVGSLRLAFSNIVNGAAQNATMTYTVNGITQTKTLERQAF